jgi:hypothetical protein
MTTTTKLAQWNDESNCYEMHYSWRMEPSRLDPSRSAFRAVWIASDDGNDWVYRDSGHAITDERFGKMKIALSGGPRHGETVR